MEFYHPEFWSGYVGPKKPVTSAKCRPAKVVSIPVHFVRSEAREKQAAGVDVQAAALRIQRASRGFLARKNLKAVRRLEAEVEAIEESVKAAEDRLRGDARERIRVSEELMSVLFRLDSIRRVRDYRRRVIRRAIALQEKVDAIAEERSESPSSEDHGDSFDCGEISEDGVEDLRVDPIEEREEGAEGPPASEAPAEEDGGRGAVERMMEENRALRGLVAGLCEKSEMQARVMSGLLERIERLEKAVEKRKRRRKRQA